jgi:hypothetical protein
MPNCPLESNNVKIAIALTCGNVQEWNNGNYSHIRKGTDIMNTFIDDKSAQQQARDWSGQLGDLAARTPMGSIPRDIEQRQGSPGAYPSRLSVILNHLRDRNQGRKDMVHKMRAQEFINLP